MGPKTIALWFLVVSVGLSAILGIIAILTGNFGDLEIRIILTTLTISAASIGALACAAASEAGNKGPLPALGIVLAILTAMLLIAGIWFEFDSKQYWKFAASMGVLAAATAHACLLSLAKLAPRFAWSRAFALAAIYALAILIILSIYIEPAGDLTLRLIGTTSIVVAAITVMIPIFHRLSRDDFNIASDEEPTSLWATITCPQCGTTQTNSLIQITCDRCGCRFAIKVLTRGRQL